MDGGIDVRSGRVSAGPPGGDGRRYEHSGGVAGVRVAPGHIAQDGRLLRASGLPEAEPAPPPQAGAVHRHHRPDTGVGPERPPEAAPHGQAHLRASAGEAWIRGPIHHRQGLRKGAMAPDQGDVRAPVPSPWPRPVRFWRGVGGERRCGAEGPRRRPGPTPQRRLLREGLPRGDHRGVSGRPRLGVRLPGRDAPEHCVRQHQAGGGQDPGGRTEEMHPSLHRAPVPLPVRGPVRQTGQATVLEVKPSGGSKESRSGAWR